MSEQELWNELGNLYFLSGSYNQASNAYQRSIQLDAGFGRPYSNLALTYVQQGKFDEAIELYRRSIELLTENKEKAVSWNRLGTVYRHLKDYSKAVIAFQEADELDPESAAEFPVTAQAVSDTVPAPSSVLDAPVAEQQETEPEIEWWDVDEKRVEAATHMEGAVPASTDSLHESWTPADPSQFQQDLAQMPQSGSLTTWGDAEVDADEDFEFFSPLAPDPELDMQESDDDLSTWLPIPEEEPFDIDLLEAPLWMEQIEILEQMEVEPPDPTPERIETPQYPVIQSVDYGSLLPAPMTAPDPVDLTERSQLISDRQENGQHTSAYEEVDIIVEQRAATELALHQEVDVIVEESATARHAAQQDVNTIVEERAATELATQQEVDIVVDQLPAAEPAIQPQADIIVEERPTADFVLMARQLPQVVEPEPVPLPIPPEPAPDLVAEAVAPAAAPAPERDEEEMREIEMGIEKFRRVVQLNPRNAHAWDALGTLYKSAGLYKDAILAYQQAISNDSSKSLYYHHLGLVYACEGRDEDAIGAFQQVVEIDPEYSLAHATLGGYYRKMGLEELAQKHIGKAMKNIFDSENEYNRACLEAICGNADQAIALLRVALKNKQTYVDWILRDPDLDFIRQDPRFKQLISDYTR